MEKAFQLPMNHFVINGKIDRIDHHAATNSWMMWDYKSGKVDAKVALSHLKKITNKTVLPAHLADDARLCYAPDEKNQRLPGGSTSVESRQPIGMRMA